MSTFRSTTVTNTSTTIKTRGADVRVVNITNKHNAIIFVRFYNSSVATFQDTPVWTIQVAATSALKQDLAGSVLFSTSNGLSVRVVTDAGDNGNTAAATLPVLEIDYN